MVRFKNRYLLCLLESEHNESKIATLEPRDILGSVRTSLAQNFGDLAVGQLQSSLAIKLWSPALHMCIIRSSRDQFRTLWGAVFLITQIQTAHHLGRVRLRVIHVGGTIRACQKSAAQHARELILNERSRGTDTSKLESAAASAKREFEAMDI